MFVDGARLLVHDFLQVVQDLFPVRHPEHAPEKLDQLVLEESNALIRRIVAEDLEEVRPELIDEGGHHDAAGWYELLFQDDAMRIYHQQNGVVGPRQGGDLLGHTEGLRESLSLFLDGLLPNHAVLCLQ